VQERVVEQAGKSTPEVTNLLDRLTQLVERATQN
jgi:hypothetical protein